MKERRPWGTGSVERHGAGWRWVARINGRRVQSRTYATQQEATEVLAAALQLLQSGQVAPEVGLTVASWGRQWLLRRNNRNHQDDAARWSRHIEDSCLADIPLLKLSRRHVRDWLSKLQRKNSAKPGSSGKVAAGTVRHCLNLLRRALSDAVDDELINLNPAAGLRIEQPAETTEPWTYLELAEIALVEQLVVEQPQRCALMLAIYSGLRQGELIGLHWQDVVLGERPQLVVRYSHGGPTKTGKIRRVPLLGPARAALAELQQLAGMPAAGLVFPAPGGDRRGRGDDFGWATKRRGAQRVQVGIKDRLGIARSVRFHDLRHTTASHLLMGSWGQSWSLPEVAAFLGHASVKMTERYAHLSADHLHRRAAETAATPPSCPQVVPSAAAKSAESPTMRPTGIEPVAHGLEEASSTVDPRGVGPVLGSSWGQIVESAALRLLQLVAAGQQVDAELVELLGVSAAHPQALRLAVSEARGILLRAQSTTSCREVI